MGTFTDWLYGRTKEKEEVHTATTVHEWDKEYTAEEVHAELTSKFLLFMEDIKRTTEYKTVPESVRQEYKTLEKLGFINSKNAELTGRIIRYVNDSNKVKEENIEALRFMKKAWETFGKEGQFSDSDKKTAENFGIDYLDVEDFIKRMRYENNQRRQTSA